MFKGAKGILKVECFPLGRMGRWHKPDKNVAVDNRDEVSGLYGPRPGTFHTRIQRQ